MLTNILLMDRSLKHIGRYIYGDVFLLVGKVKHSYAVSQTPLKPRLAVRKSGSVECGHCTCMAGLGETCSHISALLYWLETAVRVHDQTMCASKSNNLYLATSINAHCLSGGAICHNGGT